MSKNLVLSLSIGENYEKIAEIAEPLIKNYAKKCGAHYHRISEMKIAKTTPHWEKFQIYDLLNRYDRICYFDMDLLIRDDASNLFEIVPENRLGMFVESPYADRSFCIYEAAKAYNKTVPDWNGKYFNSGVMMIPKCCKQLFKKPELEFCHYYEQSYLNLAIALSGIDVFPLKHDFNHMSCMDSPTGMERHSSYVIHMAGFPGDIDALSELMKNDLSKWEQDGPEYKYQRHILISVQGGLGDQLDCLPTINYAKKYVWPGEDLRLQSHFPRLFQDVDLPVYSHDEAIDRGFDGEFRTFNSLPGPDQQIWSHVSNLLSHTVDFCAMAVLRRNLPDNDKQFTLTVNPEEIGQVFDVVGMDRPLKDYILVHPGKHWMSKTLPSKWWESVVQGLAAEGLPVCLIGKNDDTRGTINLDVPEGVIDARDLLDLGGLIAFISQAKLVISNDSAPVHIAGAFENYIILIPTCKHPDHILPFRGPNNDKKYKACAIYKKLTLDDIPSAPTEIYGQSAEFLKEMVEKYPWLNDHQGGWELSMRGTPEFNSDLEKAWEQYLPEPSEVIEKAVEYYKL